MLNSGKHEPKEVKQYIFDTFRKDSEVLFNSRCPSHKQEIEVIKDPLEFFSLMNKIMGV